MMTYTFLDPIVFLAYHVLHLSHDMLPLLADYDYTKKSCEEELQGKYIFLLISKKQHYLP